MNRKKSALVGLLLVAAVVTATWVGDPNQTAPGRALACCDTKFTTGMTGVRKGDNMYWLVPAPLNESDHEVSLIAVSPNMTSCGLEYVDARVYKRADFSGRVPIAWGGKYRTKSGDPALVKSTPVGGQKIAARKSMDDIILLRLRPTTDQLPLTASGVKVLYEQKGLRRFQVLPATFELHR